MEVKEETKKSKDGINKTAILVALILGLSIVGYGYLNISYKNKVFETEQEAEQEKKLSEELEKISRKRLLEACLEAAYDVYVGTWAETCEKQGKEEDCTLFGDALKIMEERHNTGREECFKKYPVE